MLVFFGINDNETAQLHNPADTEGSNTDTVVILLQATTFTCSDS